MKAKNKCPGCASKRLSKSWRLLRQPVVMNYRFRSERAARAVARRELRLVQCEDCGLIFNATLDSQAIPYDEHYENRQCFSPVFQDHLVLMADSLIQRHALQGERVVEVGCGKGDFLRLLCRRARCRGVGYDTSYEGPSRVDRGRVQFHQRYLKASDVKQPSSAILCRHVVEHVGNIGAFLKDLAEIARASGDPVVVIETPDLRWIDRTGSFWDLFYEHCNYFTKECLAHLCRRAGFRVLRQVAVFGGQYQWLELRLATPRHRTRPAPPCSVSLERFAAKTDAALKRMKGRLSKAGADCGWAIWGAGAKGVSLVQWFRSSPPRLVIDSNPMKQGGFIPGSNVPIVAPNDPRIRSLGAVLIANPNYRREITSTLRHAGFTNTILTA